MTQEQVDAHNLRVSLGKRKVLAPEVTATSMLAILMPKPTTDEDKLNKTEKAYLSYLRALKPLWIGVQNITLKLADDTRYTCDFFFIDEAGALHGRETKGFWRDDAKVKIKVAARTFPWIRFAVAEKDGIGWKHTEVKP